MGLSGVTFDDEAKTAAVAALDLDWMCQEVEWMEEQLSPSALSDGYGEQAGGTAVVSVDEQAKRFLSDVVLCHNDMLSGNVLHADGWDRVQVIHKPCFYLLLDVFSFSDRVPLAVKSGFRSHERCRVFFGGNSDITEHTVPFIWRQADAFPIGYPTNIISGRIDGDLRSLG